tara:strand:+ start:861 stop:1106 length:246 start_codon:yes stop_codon:yes gene_type:complete
MTERFVCFNAEEKGIRVTIEHEKAGWADTVEGLHQILVQHNISLEKDRCFCSSDVDFASEEGFANDGDAHAMINSAFDYYA